MKKAFKVIGIILLAGSLLVACSNDDENSISPANEVIEEQNEGADDGSSTEEETTNAIEDQLDLILGDTGKVLMNTGEFEITIKSVIQEENIDNEPSQLDRYHVFSVQIKNDGTTDIDLEDLKGVFEVTDLPEGAGEPEVSSWFDTFDELEGIVAPGEVIDGSFVFQVYEADTYYLRIIDGLVDSDAVKNQVIWTYENGEVQ